MTAIFTLTRDSIAAFDHAITRFVGPEAVKLQIPLKEERGRLNVWASDVGARQEASSLNSLDYRLRHAPLIRAGIVRGLERVKRLVTRILAILQGDAPNRRLSWPTHDTDQEPQADMVIRHELDELVMSTQDAVSHLFGLSILLRRQQSHGRQSTVGSLTLFEEQRSESLDISSIINLFPKTKSSLWLARRLGNATTYRRDYARYQQHHGTSLGKVILDTVRSEQLESETVKQSVVATDFQEFEQRSAISDKSDSMSSSATSSAGDSDNDELRPLIPDLPAMKVGKVQFQYGQPFKCPYCRTIQRVRNRHEWNKHVKRDLQPYICTFKDCKESSIPFSTRSEWFSHEINNHRRLWYCSLCPAVDQSFSSATDLEKHLLSITHQGKITEAQATVLVPACEHPIRIFGPSSCPLCEEWDPLPSMPNASSFSRHLARHLLKIALAASTRSQSPPYSPETSTAVSTFKAAPRVEPSRDERRRWITERIQAVSRVEIPLQEDLDNDSSLRRTRLAQGDTFSGQRTTKKSKRGRTLRSEQTQPGRARTGKHTTTQSTAPKSFSGIPEMDSDNDASAFGPGVSYSPLLLATEGPSALSYMEEDDILGSKEYAEEEEGTTVKALPFVTGTASPTAESQSIAEEAGNLKHAGELREDATAGCGSEDHPV